MLATSVDRVPAVVVVGGGASGTLTAVQLLRHAAAYGTALEVVLVDRDGRHGTGQAYATADPFHLLNARADRMSALADDPDHLLRWARENGIDAAGSDFLPRAVYGRYLRDLLGAAEREATSGGRLARVTGTVTAVTGGRTPKVHLSSGAAIEAGAVVLATGNRPPAPWPQVAAGRRLVTDPWAPGALAGLAGGAGGASVLVVGTGLTMVDLAVTLSRADPGTVTYAVSRHGLLPRTHRCPPAPPAEIVVPGGA
ncbi:MAG: FAD/NAD(P)-binding protein, partial [Actinoallomurus sp.]